MTESDAAAGSASAGGRGDGAPGFRFSTAVGSSAVASTIGVALTAVASIVIARVLGPEQNGEYALALVVASMAIAFGNFGLGPALTVGAAEGAWPAPTLRRASRLIVVWLSVVTVVMAVAAVFLLRMSWLPELPLWPSLVALVGIPIGLHLVALQGLLLGWQKYTGFNLTGLAEHATRLAAAIALVWVAGRGVSGAVLGWVLAVGCGAAVGEIAATRVHRRAPVVDGPEVVRSCARRTVRFGLETHASHLVAFLVYRVDVLLLGVLAGPEAVGFYAIVVLLVERVWLPSQAVSLVLLPWTAGEADETSRTDLTTAAARMVLFSSALLATALGALASPLVTLLYGDSYRPAVGALQILLPGAVLLGVARVLVTDIAGRGRPLRNLAATSAALVVNVALNAVMIPRWGVEGAALASSVAYLVMFVWTFRVFHQLTGASLRDVTWVRRGEVARMIRRLRELARAGSAR